MGASRRARRHRSAVDLERVASWRVRRLMASCVACVVRRDARHSCDGMCLACSRRPARLRVVWLVAGAELNWAHWVLRHNGRVPAVKLQLGASA